MPVDEVYEFNISTPANTLQASPLVTLTQFSPRIVDRIEWKVPAGSLNVIGFQIGMRGVQLIPANKGQFIIPHLTSGGWDVRDQPDSGDWSVTTFNTGMYPHSLAVSFYARLIPKPVRELALIGARELYGEPPPEWAGY